MKEVDNAEKKGNQRFTEIPNYSVFLKDFSLIYYICISYFHSIFFI